ncbi:hypothetical protein ACIRP7_04180 [Streptomyces sp. NPDC102270]|uniref:hypothetical protein n=1 Tax=Streptomyces sp. NPDC102270 TaxID=3366150 RepID=UPI003822717C
MNASIDGPRFPNDQATDFVREFQATVAPRYENRAKLETSPPLFLLRVPQASYQSGVNRVVAALTGALSQRVPYAHLPAGTREGASSVRAAPDSGLLAVDAGRQLFRSAPEHMTPDRFPQFNVMCGLVEYIRSNPGKWATINDMEAALRRDAGERRAQRGGLLAFTRMQGPEDGGGIAGFLAKLSWPVVRPVAAPVALGTPYLPHSRAELAGRGAGGAGQHEPVPGDGPGGRSAFRAAHGRPGR